MLYNMFFVSIIMCSHDHSEWVKSDLSPPLPLSSVRMLAHREDIDLERELHRTYKMFLEGQAALISHKGQPLYLWVSALVLVG